MPETPTPPFKPPTEQHYIAEAIDGWIRKADSTYVGHLIGTPRSIRRGTTIATLHFSPDDTDEPARTFEEKKSKTLQGISSMENLAFQLERNPLFRNVRFLVALDVPPRLRSLAEKLGMHILTGRNISAEESSSLAMTREELIQKREQLKKLRETLT